MEKYDLMLNMKNVRSVAFNVGFGYTIGRFAGSVISSVWEGSGVYLLKKLAKKNNRTAQNLCNITNISYDDKVEEKAEKLKNKSTIGFRA